MRIRIKNGRVVDPARGFDKAADVFVADGRIVSLGETPPAGFTAEGTIDAGGCIVCPGLVDLSARLREPGLEYKATLESEMAAAAAGGITTLAIEPAHHTIKQVDLHPAIAPEQRQQHHSFSTALHGQHPAPPLAARLGDEPSTVTLPPSTSLQPRSLAWVALLVYSLPQR